MAEEIRHYQVEQRYRVTFERAASSTKGVIGFKCEANGDNAAETFSEAEALKLKAEIATLEPIAAVLKP